MQQAGTAHSDWSRDGGIDQGDKDGTVLHVCSCYSLLAGSQTWTLLNSPPERSRSVWADPLLLGELDPGRLQTDHFQKVGLSGLQLIPDVRKIMLGIYAELQETFAATLRPARKIL